MNSLAQGYLFSFLFWSDLPLGALALVMIYHLTGGRWGDTIRRIMEALADTILLIAVLSVPVLIWVDRIYSWMDPLVATDPKIVHKHLYLNSGSFALRTIFYFLCWGVLNHLLKNKRDDAALRKLSATGLVLVGFTVTFASIDWQMSVEPKWYSTIYGMVYATGQALTAYSFALMVFGFITAQRGAVGNFRRETLWDLGNILLVLVMLWAYLSFMQYLIMWSGNLPHEVTWYLHRTQGGWQWVALALIVFQFAAPFLFLLFRKSKSTPTRLGWLGLLVFCVRILDHYWMLMPAFRPDPLSVLWPSLIPWFVMGALCSAIFWKKFSDWPDFGEAHA